MRGVTLAEGADVMGWLSDRLKPRWYVYAVGDAVREGQRIDSPYGDGFHQWRIKRAEDGSQDFISLHFTPSLRHGSLRDPGGYLFVEFDLDAARRSRDCLQEMIESLERGL